MFKWLKKLFSKKHENEEPAPEELPVVETPAETVTLTFVPAPAEEQQEMPESRYDTPEYQEFLKQQEGSSGPETPEGPAPEEESPELEISRSGETAPEEECPETAEETPEEEEPKADRSKLQY
ncbi:MAG: hypothetical protein Q4D24_13640 [Erysipelotrichaceae bacterium]|nr:hypothetical protein [Erysipelotrichaceae bacterium]